MPKKEPLNDKPHKSTTYRDMLLPEFFRVTEDEKNESGQTIAKATKEGDKEGYFWIPRIGKKGGRHFMVKVEYVPDHQLINIFAPHTKSDLSYEEMVYLRGLFWEANVHVVEVLPNITQYSQRRTNARTLARFAPGVHEPETGLIITDL